MWWEKDGKLVGKSELPAMKSFESRVTLPVPLDGRLLSAEVKIDRGHGSILVEVVDQSRYVATGETRIIPVTIVEVELPWEVGKPQRVVTMRGHTLFLQTAGGRNVGSNSSFVEMPDELVKKLDYKLRFSRGRIYGTIYNPTDRAIRSALVRIRQPEIPGKKKEISRIYTTRVEIDSQADGTFQISINMPFEVEEDKLEISFVKLLVNP